MKLKPDEEVRRRFSRRQLWNGLDSAELPIGLVLPPCWQCASIPSCSFGFLGWPSGEKLLILWVFSIPCNPRWKSWEHFETSEPMMKPKGVLAPPSSPNINSVNTIGEKITVITWTNSIFLLWCKAPLENASVHIDLCHMVWVKWVCLLYTRRFKSTACQLACCHPAGPSCEQILDLLRELAFNWLLDYGSLWDCDESCGPSDVLNVCATLVLKLSSTVLSPVSFHNITCLLEL